MPSKNTKKKLKQLSKSSGSKDAQEKEVVLSSETGALISSQNAETENISATEQIEAPAKKVSESENKKLKNLKKMRKPKKAKRKRNLQN